MAQLDFWQHLQHQVQGAPISEDDDDLEKWKKRNQVIDDVVSQAGIDNPTFVQMAKKRLVGERPPTMSAWDNIVEDFGPGIVRGSLGSGMKSLGANSM